MPLPAWPQGYGMTPQMTTWGGNILTDAANKHHIFASAMTHNCSLRHWTTNSRIEHGVSDAIEGPYVFVDVAVNTFAHASNPMRLNDGSFAIVHMGSGDGARDGGANCMGVPPPPPPPLPACLKTNSCPPAKGAGPCPAVEVPGFKCFPGVCAADTDPIMNNCGADIAEPTIKCGNVSACALAAAAECNKTAGCGAFGLAKAWGLGHTKLFSASATRVPQPDWSTWIRTSSDRSPEAEKVEVDTVGSAIHISGSLAGPWTPLKTTLKACACPSPWQLPNGTFYLVCQGTQNIQRAESLAGPWTFVTNISSNGMPGGPAGKYEDPMLYTTSRGWHLLFHVRTP